jgi:hypothetical protein
MELYVNLLFPRTKAQSPFPAGRAPGQPAGIHPCVHDRTIYETIRGWGLGDNTTCDPVAHTARLTPRASRAYVSPDPERQLQNGAPTYR